MHNTTFSVVLTVQEIKQKQTGYREKNTCETAVRKKRLVKEKRADKDRSESQQATCSA
jgi:hypothetical protein